ncbi:MAG: reductive dehalogenase [Gemmatimonadetes bacterium]|nr:reductive dehalogenase [Gemmatimonadota bacterium]
MTEFADGIEIGPDFVRFSQRDDIFSRADWDPEVAGPKADAFYQGYFMAGAKARPVEGFTLRDYALRNASWHIADVFSDLRRGDGRHEGFTDLFTAHRPGSAALADLPAPARLTAEIKQIARLFGADLVGIARSDPRWIYRESYRRASHSAVPNALPEDLPYAIVIGKGMDWSLTETVPSALAGAATGLAYSRDATTLVALAQYIRNLGYRAEASMNDSALAIPLAIQAGLGEYGRNGLLITPEFGPRLRLGKVFTDLPLEPDRPKRFGVKQFCDRCRRCAEACPVKAIPFDAPAATVHDRSNLIGVTKWTVHAAKCFGFWVNQNSDCSICIRVCPYNRDYSRWYHRLWRATAATWMRGILLWVERRLGRGERRPAGWWWKRLGSPNE